jgi:hypothetical protein
LAVIDNRAGSRRLVDARVEASPLRAGYRLRRARCGAVSVAAILIDAFTGVTARRRACRVGGRRNER